MSLVAEHDTGRRRVILNTEWPIRHMLCRYSFGYTVSTDVCGGDASLMQVRHYKTKHGALRRWREITGQELTQ